MTGIAGEKLYSLGSMLTFLVFNNTAIEHKLHIVSDDFRIPVQGILGKDFLQFHECLIDYSDMSLTIRPNGHEPIKVAIQSEIRSGVTVLPPKSETFKMFHLKSNTYPCFLEAQEIDEDIYIPNTIAYESDTYIRVLNNSGVIRYVDTNGQKFKIDDIDNYDTFAPNANNTSHNDRINELIAVLKGRIPVHAQDILLPLCEEFADVFQCENDESTVNNFYEQTLTVTDNSPVYQRNYRLPFSQKSEINDQVNQLLKKDLIELSTSNYNSPLIIVPKKSQDGTPKYRMVVDFKKLNKKLIPDRFPLPRIEDIFDNLAKAKYFSVMDLKAGYHQIPLTLESRKYTAFSTDKGQYQWKVLPFGLSIAPSSFSRMMAMAFSGLTPERCFSYMDDLITIGFSEKNHLENIRLIFETCRKYNLKLNAEKCDFFRTEVAFLGHICTNEGLKPNPVKLAAVQNYPRPRDKDSVKRFVAFLNYYRKFVENFAALAKPLTQLTRKRADFDWTQKCENSFQELKNRLQNPPILKYPDFDKEFTIIVDACDYACGAALTQKDDESGIFMPIMYISKSFNKGELNKPAIEKELLAVHFAIITLRPYVYGRQFVVKSDHKPLVYLYNLKNPSSKLSRIRLELEEYNFKIEYIPGRMNVVADALSRIKIDDLQELYPDTSVLAITRSMSHKEKPVEQLNVTWEMNDVRIIENLNAGFQKRVPRIKVTKVTVENNIITHLIGAIYQNHSKVLSIMLPEKPHEKITLQKLMTVLEIGAKNHGLAKIQWPLTDRIFKYCNINEFKEIANETLKTLTIELITLPKKITDANEKHEILKRFHEDIIYGGHCGQKRMYANIRNKYFWPKMTHDVAKYVRACKICKLTKPGRKTKEAMTLTNTPASAFDSVQIDTIGPLPKSNSGFVYAVTLVCELTKYLVAFPLTDKSADTVARGIVENFILIYSPMKEFRSDLGTEYVNELSGKICKLLNIDHSKSTAYHHQSLGVVERNHRHLNEYLRAYLNGCMSDWDTCLKYFTLCYNMTKSTTNGMRYSPFELVFGKSPTMPYELFNGKISPVYNIDNYANELRFRLQKAHIETKRIIDKIKISSKKNYDKNLNPLNIRIGDLVKIVKEPYDKFSYIFEGPVKVLNIDQPNVIVELRNGKQYKIHKNRLRKY